MSENTPSEPLTFIELNGKVFLDNSSALFNTSAENTHTENAALDNLPINTHIFPDSFYRDPTKLPNKIQKNSYIILILDSHIGDSVLTIHLASFIRDYISDHQFNNKKIILYVSPHLFQMLKKFELGDRIEIRSLNNIDEDKTNFPQDTLTINLNRHDSIKHIYDEKKSIQLIPGELINVFYFGFPRQSAHTSLGARLLRVFERMLGEKVTPNPESFLISKQNRQNFRLTEFSKIKEKYNSISAFEENKYIIIQPNASKNFKLYPFCKWVEVITDFLEKYHNKKVLILRRSDIPNLIDDNLNLLDKFLGRIAIEDISIEDLPEIINGSSLVLSCDTGLAHLSGSMGKKTIMLNSVSNPEYWHSLNPNYLIISPKDSPVINNLIADRRNKFQRNVGP